MGVVETAFRDKAYKGSLSLFIGEIQSNRHID